MTLFQPSGSGSPAQSRRVPHSQAQDPETWPVIRQSAARLSRDQDAFVQQLHYDVTRLVPELAGAGAPDLRAFCERMARTLLWVALTEQPLGVVADTLRRVGAQNWAEGFPETHYGNVAHALVQTVHYLNDSDWSASMGSMWIGFFMWIKPHLLAGAQQAAEENAAAWEAAEQQAAAQRAAGLGSAAGPLDGDDDEDLGHSPGMASMSRTPRRDYPRHAS